MSDKKERKHYFEYQPGDLDIVESICDVCIYNNTDDQSICEKYPNGKPVELLDPDAYCQLLSNGVEF